MLRLAALLSLVTAAFSLQGAIAGDTVYTKRFSNLAVDGYDPVAYFTAGAPTKGSKEFSFEYKGAEWLFASAENLAKFKADPAAFAPQYGGYCAWAVSQNYTARGNPNYWTIVDNRLYLNYDKRIQARWEKDIPGFISQADANWPELSK